MTLGSRIRARPMFTRRRAANYCKHNAFGAWKYLKVVPTAKWQQHTSWRFFFGLSRFKLQYGHGERDKEGDR